MSLKLAWGVSLLLLCGSIVSADLVLPRKRETDQRIPGLRTRSYTETFKGQERALVIVSGNWESCLGLYIFDARGNCVARDDRSGPQTADDLAVEWIPPEQGRYSIEVRNGGVPENVYQIAVR